MRTLFTFLFACCFVIFSFAQPGSLDSTFGINGKVLDESHSSFLQKIALQSDGKIVGCGQFYFNNYPSYWLVRYNKNGSPDTSFGVNGLSAKTIHTITSLAIQKDNKIVTAGYSTVALKISRYTRNGLLDKTFGDKGTATTDFSKHEYPGDIAIQPDGKIIVCGYVRNNPNEARQGFLVRYLQNGALDTSFGINGISIFLPPDRNASISIVGSMVLQTDGKIDVDITYVNYRNDIVYRFNTNGSLDSSFGNYGTAFFAIKNDKIKSFRVNSLLVQKDNKVVGCGSSSTGPNGFRAQMLICRLNANGSVDSSFAVNGVAGVIFQDDASVGTGILLQPDGKIVASGRKLTKNHSYSSYFVSRFNKNGSLDTTFGDKGLQVTSVTGQDFSTTSVLQPDGKIIVGGNSDTDSSYTSLVRYNNVNRERAAIANNSQLVKNETSTNIKIYPNPAQNTLHVNGLSSSQKTKLTVIDFMGNIKMQTTANNSSYNLNIASLKAGNYLLKIEMEGSVITKKFVKE